MDKPLDQKSLHQLRGIAQSFGITNIFEKDAKRLSQEIQLKQQAVVAPKAPPIPQPPYDARLMTKAPAKRSNPQELVELLAEHIRRGLNVRFDEERWYMTSGVKTDEGTLRMPLRSVITCADKMLK